VPFGYFTQDDSSQDHMYALRLAVLDRLMKRKLNSIQQYNLRLFSMAAAAAEDLHATKSLLQYDDDVKTIILLLQRHCC